MTFSFSKVRFFLSCGPANNTARPDADFLARGENSPERFFRIFRELCSVETEPDGLRFDPDTVTVERIAEDADYEGVRVSFTAYLERAKIPIQIDIGFGDAVTPPPVENNDPTLLGSTAPRLLAYPSGDGCCRKTGSDGQIGNCQQPNERLLRHGSPVPHLFLRRQESQGCHPQHFQAARDGTTIGWDTSGVNTGLL